MDGENNGKPYERMDDLGVPLFLETLLWELCLLEGITLYLREVHDFQYRSAEDSMKKCDVLEEQLKIWLPGLKKKNEN